MASSWLEGLAGKRILILNWRDPWHPLAGGAEQYCWEVATRLATAEAKVTLFAASVRGRPAEEATGGVQLLRRGGTFTIYVRAAWYLMWHRRRVDAVVDCQNGIPFFAPLFLMNRAVAVILLVHHVHQEQFSTRFKWPMTWVGRVLEGPCSRWVYRRRPIVAVSPSTRANVRQRLRLRGPIFVVPNGLGPDGLGPASVPADPGPRLVYVGRLVPHKRLELLLDAFAQIRPSCPELTLDIAGTGPCLESLTSYADNLGVSTVVRFRGRVSDRERRDLLSRAWLMVIPSKQEGWGLTVLEANRYGCPALGFRVPGLLDSIVHGQNGWLVDEPLQLGGAITTALQALALPGARLNQAERCREWARSFSWQRSAEWLASIITAHRYAPLRSQVTDLATVAILEMHGECAQAVKRLPPTCLWSQRGRQLEILVYGMDTQEVAPWLATLGFQGKLATRVACSRDLLLGPFPA